MREAIRELIEIEQQAKQAVDDAEKEGDRGRRDARIEADALVDKARADATARSDAVVTEALRRAREEKARRLDETRQRIETETGVDEATRRDAVDTVVAQLAGE